MLYEHILDTIGNTPLVRLKNVTKDIKAKVYAKVESFNPGHSVKDRIGVKLVDDAEKNGLLKPGGTIVEGTSGNTGMSLALTAIARGYKCIFTTNDKQSQEKIDMLKAVGAEVIVCPTNVTADDPRSYYSVAKKISEETSNSFYVNQYFNLSNRQAHYETTGPEIWEATEGKITHFVAGVGTGGTISGTAKYLKEQNREIKVWGIDTFGSALKKFHETGKIDENEIYSYITEGIGEDIIPANVDFSVIDHFEKVTDKDGALMAREITRQDGIFVGYSCGSAVAGLIQMAGQLTENDLVVIIFPDHGSRYVGKLYNEEWMRERRFLDEEIITARSILNRKKSNEFVSVQVSQSLDETIKLMHKLDLSQLPVTSNGEVVGSISESCVLNALLEHSKEDIDSIGEIMTEPFPLVDLSATTQEISTLINKRNGAVFVKDITGNPQIITEYDLINAIAG